MYPLISQSSGSFVSPAATATHLLLYPALTFYSAQHHKNDFKKLLRFIKNPDEIIWKSWPKR